jgi:hypothetical protein
MHAPLTEILDRVADVGQVPAETVQPPHNEGVPRAAVVQGFPEFGTAVEPLTPSSA